MLLVLITKPASKKTKFLLRVRSFSLFLYGGKFFPSNILLYRIKILGGVCLEYNRKVREELWGVIEGLTDDQINRVVEEGKWTIGQVLEHLYLTEKNVVQSFSEAKQITEENPVKLRKVHLTTDRTQRVNAPKFLVPSSRQQTLEQLKEKLKQSRENLENFMKDTSEDHLNGKYMPHPFFEKLTLTQWVEFLAYHEKRHIAQIEELKEAIMI